MMNLIIQLTAQLKEMENDMDKLVQEKRASIEAILVIAIPTVTTKVPSTSATPVATTLPVATTFLSTSSTTSATDLASITAHPSDEASELIKAMKNMSIKINEIIRLK